MKRNQAQRKRTYNKRKPQNKKTYYKRKNNKVTTGYSQGATGIPDRMMLKMIYADTIRLTNSMVHFDNHTFSGNDLNDPNVSGIGHQPKSYDQWSQFYNKTMVHGSSIECRFTPTQSSGDGNTNIYLIPTIDSATLPGWIDIQENKLGKADVVGPYVGMGLKYLKDYMSTKKLFGDVNGLEQSDYGAFFNFSPINKWYWVIGAETQNGNAVSVDVSVVITYYVELFDRKDLPGS